jgi:hypothetical protein
MVPFHRPLSTIKNLFDMRKADRLSHLIVDEQLAHRVAMHKHVTIGLDSSKWLVARQKSGELIVRSPELTSLLVVVDPSFQIFINAWVMEDSNDIALLVQVS